MHGCSRGPGGDGGRLAAQRRQHGCWRPCRPSRVRSQVYKTDRRCRRGTISKGEHKIGAMKPKLELGGQPGEWGEEETAGHRCRVLRRGARQVLRSVEGTHVACRDGRQPLSIGGELQPHAQLRLDAPIADLADAGVGWRGQRSGERKLQRRQARVLRWHSRNVEAHRDSGQPALASTHYIYLHTPPPSTQHPAPTRFSASASRTAAAAPAAARASPRRMRSRGRAAPTPASPPPASSPLS